MKQGILIFGENDPAISSRAKSKKLGVTVAEEYTLPFEKTLIVESGTRIPWDLLPAAWNFLDRWDCAVPLWRYGVTAEDLGSSAEQELTRSIVRDLRVLNYSYELLFMRRNKTSEELLETWGKELERGPEKRLAFLRAFYQVKPRLCVLPVSWLAEVRAYKETSQAANRYRRGRRAARKNPQKLVKVKVGPNRFVKCAPGDEERVRQFYLDKEKRG